MNKQLIAALLGTSVLLLAGCGGGSSAGGSSPAAAVILTVTPSLGKVKDADVKVVCLPTAAEIGVGHTGIHGSAPVELTTTCPGPVKVDVVPTPTSTYYDESLQTEVPLPPATELSAIIPDLNGVTEVGVTALTQAAASDAIANAVSTGGTEADVTKAQAEIANANVVSQVLGSGVTLDVLKPPTVVDSTTGAGTLGNTDSDKYAFYLASLARLGGTAPGTTPAVNVVKALAQDLEDNGQLDGATGDVKYTAANFENLLVTAQREMKNYADSELLAGPLAHLTNLPHISATPAIGKVLHGGIEVKCLATGKVIGVGDTGSDGHATVDLTAMCEGPSLFGLVPNGNTTYFDVAASATVALPTATTLRAVVPNLNGVAAVAMTTLTEAATRDALNAAGNVSSSLTATLAQNANTEIVAKVLGSGTTLNILQPPTLLDINTALGSLGSTAADQYAFQLASLARMGGTTGTPALNVMNALSVDLADGALNGSASGSVTYSPANFLTLLASAQTSMASLASADLKTLFNLGTGSGTGTSGSGTGSSGTGTSGGGGTTIPVISLYNLTVSGTYTAPVIGQNTIPNLPVPVLGVSAPTLDELKALVSANFALGNAVSMSVTPVVDSSTEKKYRVQFSMTVLMSTISYDLTYDYVKQA